jgi:hypothetical protein
MSTAKNYRGPNIIKDGLVLYLDVATNNSYNRYISTATWRDISGNGNNGTLVNGPTFSSSNGGNIVFDGTDDYVDNVGSVSSFSFIQNTGIYTISAWVKPSVINIEMYILGNNNGTSGQKGFYFGTGNGTSITMFASKGTAGIPVLSFTVSNCFLNTTDWVNIVVVGNGTTNQFYRNGVVFGASSNTSTLSVGDSSFSLGVGFVKNTTNSWLWKGAISNITIYNKALTATEVLQNYNATKSRFGL